MDSSAQEKANREDYFWVISKVFSVATTITSFTLLWCFVDFAFDIAGNKIWFAIVASLGDLSNTIWGGIFDVEDDLLVIPSFFFVVLFLSAPFSWWRYMKIRAADRSCTACGAAWALFWDGNSIEVIDTHQATENVSEKESKVMNGQNYVRDVFKDNVYEITEYDALIECKKCQDITRDRRIHRVLINSSVTAVSEWRQQ